MSTHPCPAFRLGAVLCRYWVAFTRRPFEVLVLLALALTGLHDLASSPLPPEIAGYAADVVFHLYGLYLLTGALAALWAVLTPWSCRARRTERAGLLTVSFATGTLTAIMLIARTGVADTPGTTDEYSIGTLAAIAVASLARWWSLRDPRPPLPKPGEHR
jgi:hypothetical protein